MDIFIGGSFHRWQFFKGQFSGDGQFSLSRHYSKTVWLAENLNEIKITHYEKIFSHIKQKFSHFEKGLGINNIFVVSLRLPLFSPRYITLKRNQKIISKISNYLT